uniref:Uncharacterized protein n=1 Tax=Panagrolaimus sp. JU765 TaxID=591449 RepID=A0AC34PXR8_9BILA
MLTAAFKVAFSFAEVGFCGFLCLFMVLPYYIYSFLKHWLIQRFSAKFGRFKQLLHWVRLNDDKFGFQSLPYPMKRRFVQLLPPGQLQVFQQTDKTNAKMSQILRGAKTVELIFDLTAVLDSCIIKGSPNSSESAFIVPSNLICSDLGIFKKQTNFERFGIVGPTHPTDAAIDQILDCLPNNFTADYLFADFEVENLKILVRLLEKTKPVKLVFSLGFTGFKPDLDQLLEVIPEESEEIQICGFPFVTGVDGRKIETWISNRKQKPKLFSFQTISETTGDFVQLQLEDSDSIWVKQEVGQEPFRLVLDPWISVV